MSMVRKCLPIFSFLNPTNRNIVDIRITSVDVTTTTTRLRTVWTPEMAQELNAFHNIDAEAELTELLSDNIWNEIYREMILDLNNNQRFYGQNDLRGALDRWDQIQNGFLINNNISDFNLLPIATRVASQTIGLDLTPIRPLENPILPIEAFNALPDEEGWFTNGTFESLFIKMNMKSFDFIIPFYLKNRRLQQRRNRNRGV